MVQLVMANNEGRIKLVGIINVTPDSFSDGGNSKEAAIEHAENLIAEGAQVIDIGGDSTRPGSLCVGPEEEWNRIGDIISGLKKKVAISVDTHHAHVAEYALRAGAVIINDVSAGSDSEMFSIVARKRAGIILMYSRCPEPHFFGEDPDSDIVDLIKGFLISRIELALNAGVSEGQIILDPGMGAFLSSKSNDSWEVLKRLDEIAELGFPIMLGISRKGFLKGGNETSPKDRDKASAEAAIFAISQMKRRVPIYLRVHNVAIHREALKAFAFSS